MTVPTTTRSDLGQTARLFHALSDETRLSIMGLLSRGERCVCELTDALDAGQSRLSFHLKALKEAGLVTDRREGRGVYYALSPEGVTAVGQALGSIEDWAPRNGKGKEEGCC
jgi:ArsR family transcriptional regulator, arsenate/arsenite/antimonite-responsive transcriptional repressor